MAGHGGARKGAGRKPRNPLLSMASVSATTAVDTPSRNAAIIDAVPDEAFEQMMRSLPPDVTAHQLLNEVVRSPLVPGPIRMHAAAKLLPFEVAKPSTSKEQGSGGIVFRLGRHGAATD